MPNGNDKSWIRFCAAIDGFRVRYDKWPEVVRMSPALLSSFCGRLLTKPAFEELRKRASLAPDDRLEPEDFWAEDATGRRYSYLDDGFPNKMPRVSAKEWLGVEPQSSASSLRREKKEKAVRPCECGCETEAQGAFLPGHDQKLRGILEARVGGLLVMRGLVDAMESYAKGATPLEELGMIIRGAFWSARISHK